MKKSPSRAHSVGKSHVSLVSRSMVEYLRLPTTKKDQEEFAVHQKNLRSGMMWPTKNKISTSSTYLCC